MKELDNNIVEKKMLAKKAPAKRAYTVEGYNNNRDKVDAVISIMLLSKLMKEVTNTITGEIQYILENEFSNLYILASDFYDMVSDNIDVIYTALENEGLQGLQLAIDNTQAHSKQLKVVAYIGKSNLFSDIESYRYETDIKLTVNDGTQDSLIPIIDTMLTM